MPACKSVILGGLLAAIFCSSTSADVGVPLIELYIRDHLFFPSEIFVPARQKVRLIISNHDATAEEFESYSLNREKIIPPESTVTLFIGPLAPGRYLFFGEFFPETAQGVVVVE